MKAATASATTVSANRPIFNAWNWSMPGAAAVVPGVAIDGRPDAACWASLRPAGSRARVRSINRCAATAGPGRNRPRLIRRRPTAVRKPRSRGSAFRSAVVAGCSLFTPTDCASNLKYVPNYRHIITVQETQYRCDPAVDRCPRLVQ